MQTTITSIIVLASAAVAAACGGRIETVPLPAPASEPETEPAPATSSSPALAEPAAPASCATFAQVLAALDTLGCSHRACHGGPSLPLIDAARPLETQRGFYAFVLSDGTRYVDFRSLDPSSSGITCNLRGDCGVRMPLGGSTVPASTVALIDRWLACGASQ